MHELLGCVADLRAIQQQRDMPSLGMRSAHSQAMRHKFQARILALVAHLRAAAHVLSNCVVLLAHDD
jgi:hypothetical protein